MVTHAVPFDAYRQGFHILAECGRMVWIRDVAEEGAEPSCSECRAALAQTAEDVFGTVEEIRQYGPTVTPKDWDR